MKKEIKRKKNLKVKEIIVMVFLFILVFSLAFYSIFKLMNKKIITEYYDIELNQKSQSGITYYDATFKDTYGEDFFFRFFNNPYDIENIEISGEISLKDNTIIFTDDIDKCENFYDNVIGFPIFLQKMTGVSSEVRSIEGVNISNYNLSENTLIYVKKIGFIGRTSIEKTETGYIIYVKNCEIEKSFERFILAAYLNKNNITLNNQVY
jgi:hypothetical protein